jgi:Ca-activated chloride channel family protein
MKRWIWFISICSVCCGVAPSFATGLFEEGDAVGLVPLQILEVDTRVDAGTAVVTETRRYVLAAAEQPRTVKIVFHRTLVDPEARVEVAIDGIPVVGATLLRQPADLLREDLVRRAGDPGPLRDYGMALFVTAPVEVEVPVSGQVIEVTSVVTEAVSPWDTMRATRVPIDWHWHPVDRMSVSVEVSTQRPLRAVYSPFHTLEVTREGRFSARGSYTGTRVCTAYEVTLLHSVGEDPIHVDLLPFRADAQEGGFYMALISSDEALREIAVQPRDIVLVLDRSGSMRGEKIAQARQALITVLGELRPTDRIALVWFDASVETFSELAVPADPDQIDAALEFVESLSADGGTNIADGLAAGLRSFPLGADRPRYLLLLTDGVPTEGEIETDAIVSLAKQQNEVDARIFTFGIGDDVNTVLLDRLVIDSGGAALYIRPGQSVTTAVEGFFQQIAAPIVARPSLDLGGFGGVAPYPETLPDLFAGETIAIVGRYTRPGSAELVLRGLMGGDDTLVRYRAALPEYSVRNTYVPRIWATRHVGTLLGRVRLGDEDPALIDEVAKVARRFGVITEFTFFERDEDGNARFVYSPVPLDSTGSVAVDTSSSLGGYQDSGTARAVVESWIRYQADRIFPTVAGWFTDTYLDDEPAFVELHFGSDRYYQFVAEEGAWGAGGRLSVDREVAFELRGRAFRITDPVSEERETYPAESTLIPSAPSPVEESASAHYVETETIDDDIDIDDPIDDDIDTPEQPAVASVARGCAVAAEASPTVWHWLLRR